jgi:DNA-binding transcriptional MerR regulator
VVKTQFGIKDLENLSNVKAHTIRIWEKRYNLLEPERTDTNIRKYNIENLKKLLNIAYLYNSGYKISTLANFEPQKIQDLINENLKNSNYVLNVFKSAMLQFDGKLFDDTLERLLEEKSLREIFSEIFVPLLKETGVLWHSGTIDPSHEHFISEKIKHSIIQNTNKAKQNKAPLFTLYLPYGEIHEIGLLYANYELHIAGQNTIYLGPNIPLESLNHLLKNKEKVVFITYFTIHSEKKWIDKYIDDFLKNMLAETTCELWILGQKENQKFENHESIKFFKDSNSFLQHLDSLESN